MDLIVRLRGKEILRLELKDGSEYLAGRAPECAIPLENAKGISRHHVQIAQRDGVWVAALMSRFGGLIYEGENVQAIELADNVTFAVPPYEFAVQPSLIDVATRAQTITPTATVSASMVPVQQPPTFTGNIEATQAGGSRLQAYFKVYYGSSKTSEVIRLEGNLWVAGRDSNCEIYLNDRHISRRHFELTYINDGYFITELGSSNGTHVNEEALTPHEPFRLHSGDEIRIMNVEISFEIRDTQFESKINKVPTAIEVQWLAEMEALPPAGSSDEVFTHNAIAPSENSEKLPAVVIESPGGPVPLMGQTGAKNRAKMFRFGVVLLAVLAAAAYLALPTGKKEKKQGQSTSMSMGPANYETLTPENKSAVRDLLTLINNLYHSGKYELCLAESKKLHALVPFYENSEEVLTLCQQSLENAKIKADLEYKQQEKIRRERELQTITEGCAAKLTQNLNMPLADMESCLAPATELDPENAKIVELTTQIKMRDEQHQQQEREAEASQERIQAAEALYRRAHDKVRSGRLHEGIEDFDKLMAGGYPNPGGIKEKAKTELAAAKKELNDKVSQALSSCQDSLEKARYRAAYDACRTALDEDPKSHKVQETADHALSELRREMKAIYEDSSLEESLGNIDAAKEKWKRLMQDDLPSDDYYIKAKLKLQKYGVGI